MKRTCLQKNTNTEEQNTCEFHPVDILFKELPFDSKDIQQVKRLVQMKFTQHFFLFFSGFLLSISALGQQGFLHADGQKIVDSNGNNVLLRGMGLGGWMLQEGYMMESSDFANTQHDLKTEIEQLVGTDGMNNFYDAWLVNYCTKTDIDSMAAWGFNSIRLPMHYNLFTLPIEDEPVVGQDTWLDEGFSMVDMLLDWCEANQIYLILDLHAAPGGQGKDAAISDYDSSKKSLWESAENRRKTVALWKKLAERYANEPWIGGFDLLNETNWEMSGNLLLKNLYFDITKAIREVDSNHLLFIEGNWFANDFTGLIPPWDNNMSYSFHKYWSYNNVASIQWVLDIRKNYNVPIWLGESGENSNVWFTNAIKLMEDNNIGWAWWPYKKIGSVTGTVTIPKTTGYQQLLNYWNGNSAKPNATDAANWLLEQAEMLKLEKCTIHPDVLDAMFRQAQGDKSPKPFMEHTLPGTIFAANFDLGGNGFAYFDVDSADYHVSTDSYTAWNSGYGYRNDAVDIEACSDAITNGYSVGWTNKGEWLNYTVEIDSTAAYTFELRYAANSSTGQFHIELDGVNIISKQTLATTGGWYNWKSLIIENIILEKGSHRLKFVIDESGFNLNSLSFTKPKALSDVPAEILSLKTTPDGNYIQVITNLGIDDGQLPSREDFVLKVNNVLARIEIVEIDKSSNKTLVLKTENEIIGKDVLILSYKGNGLKSPFGQTYSTFSNRKVENISIDYTVIPAKIQAEDFSFNNGLEVEVCSDTGGGSNLGYANAGDYVDYQVYLYSEGEYQINYRVASQNSGRFKTQLITKNGTIDLHLITVSTGSWQTWKTQTETVFLPKGKLTLRIYVVSGEFNLNWLQVAKVTGVDLNAIGSGEIVFVQNKGANSLSLINKKNLEGKSMLEIYDLMGRKIALKSISLTGNQQQLVTDINLSDGGYILIFKYSDKQVIQKLWMQ